MSIWKNRGNDQEGDARFREFDRKAFNKNKISHTWNQVVPFRAYRWIPLLWKEMEGTISVKVKGN
jgi:hypothetical protein